MGPISTAPAIAGPRGSSDEARLNGRGPADPPFVSIIIAVRNGAATLQRCLDSVLAQTFNAWELIVVDGNSSDGTLDLLKSYSGRIHYWVSEPDAGIYAAWNKALTKTRGTWICFLGADDSFARADVLELMVEHLTAAEGNVRVVYGSVNVVDESGAVLTTIGQAWPSVRAVFRDHMAIPHQGVFHHRSLFDDHGHFDEGYRICGDYEFLLRELVEHDASFVPELVVVCMGSGGLSSRPDSLPTVVRELDRARRAHGLTRRPELLSGRLWRALSRVWLTRALGPKAAETAARGYRFFARKPRQPARYDGHRPRESVKKGPESRS